MTNKTVTRLGGQALYFLLGNVFTLVVGFPLQVYVARVLGADNLGVFSLFDGAASLGANLVSFGLAPTLVKFIPHSLAKGDHAGVRLLITRGLLLLLLSGGVAVLGVWALQLWRVPVPLLTSKAEVATLMAVLVPLSLLAYFFQQGLRGFQDVRYMVMGTSFLQLGVKALLAVVLLQQGYGLIGYVIAVLVSTLVCCLWLARGLWRHLAALSIDAANTAAHGYRKEWRDYAMVFYLDGLLGVFASYADRFLLGWMAGAAAVGVLVLVKQLNTLPGVFFQMFMSIASPMFSAAHARNDELERQHLYHLIVDWVLRLSFPLCLFLLVFAEPMLGLYRGDIAAQGSLSLRILVTAQLLNLAMGPLGNMLTLSGSETLALKWSLIEQVVMVVGLCLLVPRFGIEGAVAILAFRTIEQNAVFFVVARRRLGIRWFDRRFLKWIVPGLVTLATALSIHWYTAGELGAVPLAMTVVLLYGVFFAIALLQGLHADDKTMLSFVIKRILQEKE